MSITTDRGNPSTLQPSLKNMGAAAFLADDAHVQIVGPGRDEWHALYIGSYDSTGTITLYSHVAGLQLLRDAIDAHLDAVARAAAEVDAVGELVALAHDSMAAAGTARDDADAVATP